MVRRGWSAATHGAAGRLLAVAGLDANGNSPATGMTAGTGLSPRSIRGGHHLHLRCSGPEDRPHRRPGARQTLPTTPITARRVVPQVLHLRRPQIGSRQRPTLWGNRYLYLRRGGLAHHLSGAGSGAAPSAGMTLRAPMAGRFRWLILPLGDSGCPNALEPDVLWYAVRRAVQGP